MVRQAGGLWHQQREVTCFSFTRAFVVLIPAPPLTLQSRGSPQAALVVPSALRAPASPHFHVRHFMEQLILVRHGVTANNAARLIQGTQDIPLSEAGHRQAAGLAEALSSEKIDLIISSPQVRALLTAEAAAKHHRLAVVTDKELRERSFGIFQGGPVQAYQDALAASGLPRWDFKPDGGETIHEVWARCAEFLQRLKHSTAKHALVVAHEGVNRCLILMILGRSVTEWTTFKQENCCINQFWFRSDGSVDSYELNKTAHLPELA
jgi:probable phosphoglycerate mutase